MVPGVDDGTGLATTPLGFSMDTIVFPLPCNKVSLNNDVAIQRI